MKKTRELFEQNKRHLEEFTELNKSIKKQVKLDKTNRQEGKIEKIIEVNRSLKSLNMGVGGHVTRNR